MVLFLCAGCRQMTTYCHDLPSSSSACRTPVPGSAALKRSAAAAQETSSTRDTWNRWIKDKERSFWFTASYLPVKEKQRKISMFIFINYLDIKSLKIENKNVSIFVQSWYLVQGPRHKTLWLYSSNVGPVTFMYWLKCVLVKESKKLWEHKNVSLNAPSDSSCCLLPDLKDNFTTFKLYCKNEKVKKFILGSNHNF